MASTEQMTMINLTEAAALKLQAIMAEKGLQESHALRVFVAGGGCGGMQYGMTFDDNPQDTDVVFEQQGLRVLVDPRSIQYISGANIDYVESLMGGGFQIENPNAVSTCGCGQSFRTADGEDADEDACGCGGGCH